MSWVDLLDESTRHARKPPHPSVPCPPSGSKQLAPPVSPTKLSASDQETLRLADSDQETEESQTSKESIRSICEFCQSPLRPQNRVHPSPPRATPLPSATNRNGRKWLPPNFRLRTTLRSETLFQRAGSGELSKRIVRNNSRHRLEFRSLVHLPTSLLHQNKAIMPRGQKSKLRAREKRRQAQEDSQNLGLQRATFTTTTAAALSFMRSIEGANEVEERPRFSQNPTDTQPFYRSPLEEKVFILVYYLLYKYQMKEFITKADMLRNVIQIYRNQFHEILGKASEKLELVFGLDVREVDPNKHIYVLINKLEPTYDGRLSVDSSVPETGLLMTVLGVIFIKGNCATEEQVWEVLNMMGLYSGQKHFIYGEPRKLITRDLVKENYLQYQQVPNSDPPRYEFLWGPRAHAETSKMKVLEFLAKIHDTVPTAFPLYYEEALRDEEERARARATTRARIAAMASARAKALASSSSHP
ncbi:melanoma-associated antigen B10-like [Hyaena hyaena]|uniref:melanoma-associated antigen B10-like n=1 Tax=Hyaena hyaena TaxID=95912 RepID=UPI001922F625|nr:melanoma-associated antigen B10-like [Hyaena hyaena]